MEQELTRAWYQNPYVLMLVAIPLTAVLLGIALVSISILYKDDMVVDDYYRQGKEINRILDRDKTAASMGLSAIARFNRDEGKVEVVFRARSGFRHPDSIKLKMIHATRSDLDYELLLPHLGDGRYIQNVSSPAQGKWYLQIGDDVWRITGHMSHDEASVILGPEHL